MGLPSFTSFGGHVKRCAVYLRGRKRCVWCTVPLLDTTDATVDHYDGDHWNNKPDNLLSSCRLCNWERNCSGFSDYLLGKGQRLRHREAVAARQLLRPLPIKAARVLAKEWYPRREGQLRAARERYEIKRKARDAEKKLQMASMPLPDWVTEPIALDQLPSADDIRADLM
jgi:hypothetical protein